jgi:uncharacterized protein
MRTSPVSSVSAPAPEARITLIDALRGSALAGLFVVHCVEHFELTIYPEHSPAWLHQLDEWTNHAAFFLFGGKAYAIFAMMFGLSFAIILDRWTKRGVNVGTRFPWRLILLGAFGYVNGILYDGDILLILAVLGLPLVLLHRFSDRVLVALTGLLLLRLPSVWQTAHCLIDPAYAPPIPVHWDIVTALKLVYAHGSLSEVVTSNLGTGQMARIWYTYESGRYLQMMGLFICGLLLGRHRVLEDAGRARILARRALIWGLIVFALLYPVKLLLPHWGFLDLRLYVVDGFVGGFCNLAQMAVWVGAFILLYLHGSWRRGLDWFVPFGRMSLTCYVTQALVGVPFFFGYGLGMYRYLGQFNSVLCGLGFLVLQGACAHWWMRHFYYGPLEWLWRVGTMGSFRTPFRKTAPLRVGGEAVFADGVRE